MKPKNKIQYNKKLNRFMQISERFALNVGVAALHIRWLLWQLQSDRERE